MIISKAVVEYLHFLRKLLSLRQQYLNGKHNYLATQGES